MTVPGSSFSPGDLVVYPAHGVGKIESIETRRVDGHEIKLFVIGFEDDKMTLRIPVPKAQSAGLRTLSSPQVMKSALKVFSIPAVESKASWIRLAPEFLTKVNSGVLSAIAEVVRDLHLRSKSLKGMSQSQRELYERALARLVAEVAAIEDIERAAASERIMELLGGS